MQYHPHECPICKKIHRNRGKCCCKECSYELRRVTTTKNGTEILRRQKISEGHKKRSEKDIKKTTQKRKETCLKRYGVEVITQSEEITKKRKETCLKRYGVDWVSKSEEVKSKMWATKEKNDTLPNSPKVIQKMLDTFNSKSEEEKERIKVKSIRSSLKTFNKRSKTNKLFDKIFSNILELEDEFRINYGKHRKWFIDFYSKKFDVYIQIDGIYWHGTDKSILDILCEIDKTGHRHAIARYYHKITDIIQNNFFNENNFKLYRITDIDLINCVKKYWPYYKNSTNSEDIPEADNSELAFKLLDEMSYFKSSATTIEKHFNESHKNS